MGTHIVIAVFAVALCAAAGMAFLLWARERRAAHAGQGAAPAGNLPATLAWMALWSASFFGIGWLWGGALTVFVASLAVLAGVLYGEEAAAWGPWQQVADSIVASLLISAPPAFLLLYFRP
jgi:hypothetical protein